MVVSQLINLGEPSASTSRSSSRRVSYASETRSKTMVGGSAVTRNDSPVSGAFITQRRPMLEDLGRLASKERRKERENYMDIDNLTNGELSTRRRSLFVPVHLKSELYKSIEDLYRVSRRIEPHAFEIDSIAHIGLDLPPSSKRPDLVLRALRT